MIEIYSSISRTAIEAWIKLFKKYPWPTASITMVSIAVMVFISYQNIRLEEYRETERLKNLNYKTQIQQLEQTEDNLEGLIKFIIKFSIRKDTRICLL